MHYSSSTACPAPSRLLYLDALRGLAALLVIIYHVGEAFGTELGVPFMNHAYLAVDFFFLLSGYVQGHAYDSRWQASGRGQDHVSHHQHTTIELTTGRYLRSRIARLHPMLIAASLLGVLAYIVGGATRWGDTVPMSAGVIALAWVLQLFMVPALPDTLSDVRGFGEMFPLVGPSWSLFFEYVISLLYGLWIRRMGRRGLTVLLMLSGIGLGAFALSPLHGSGNMGFGWSLSMYGWAGGLLKVLFGFTMGLWLYRHGPRLRYRSWMAPLCALLFVGVALMPNLTPALGLRANLLYDFLVVALLFPPLISLSASVELTPRIGKVAALMGAWSYPLYITHYPFFYLYYRAVWSLMLLDQWRLIGATILLIGVSLSVSWLLMRYYEPWMRRQLSQWLRL